MVEQQELQRFSQQLAAFDDRLAWLRDADAELDSGTALAEPETCREEEVAAQATICRQAGQEVTQAECAQQRGPRARPSFPTGSRWGSS